MTLDLRVQLEPPEIPALRDRLDLPVLPEILDRLVQPVLLVPLVLQEIPVQLALKVR